ncbi:MAG: alpha/beta fold hydrolase [Alphaproteobacteria bacterium]
MPWLDIAAWLQALGLGQYAAPFAANDIDGDTLATLADGDLKELGVASLGHRKKILQAISALSDRPAPPVPEAPALPARPGSIPRHLAERILAARETLVGERKEVTVLFADVQGSFALIEDLDPEQTAARLAPVVDAMIAAVHRFEGTVNKVQGDGIMALFGAPIAHEDHALRACYAALAMRDEIAELCERTRRSEGYEALARVGVHSGEVVVRAIGTDLSVDYDAIGQTVHLASRLEQLALPGTIRLSAATHRLATGFVTVESLGPVPIKGLSEPIEVFELRGATSARNRLQALGKRGLSPFVGRQDEMAVLDRALRLAKAGQGQIVALVGEPGVGKSRMSFEFARSPAAADDLVLAGNSVSYGRATSWLPVIELLKAYFHVEPGDDERAIREKVTGKVLSLDEALRPAARMALRLLKVAVNDPAWDALEPPQRRRMAIDAVRSLLVAESLVQPLVLIFEDLHWADAETLSLLDSLVAVLPTNRVMMLVTYRPEFSHGWGGRGHYTQVRLDPLPPVRVEDLLGALVGGDASLAPLRAKLTSMANGNPLFIEESIGTLVEQGALLGGPGAYRLVSGLTELAIPDTVRAIIAARIDRLEPQRKQLLQAASVVGSEVPRDQLVAIADLDDDALDSGLAALQAAEFVYETRLFPERQFTFKHAFTHEVAYDGLLRARRRELHARLGAAIEAKLGANTEVEALAGHFERGEAWDKAARYWLTAAEQAKARYAYVRAIDFGKKALACARRHSSSEDATQSALAILGDLAGLRGNFEDANTCYRQALELHGAAESRRSIENRVHHRAFVGPDGARIAYYIHGTGDETIVVISPSIYIVHISQPLLERMCQVYRVVTVHPRGDSPSDPAPRPYTLREQADDFRRVIEALGPRPKTAIGISRGGTIAVLLAREHPGLLDRVVLVGTPVDDMVSPGYLLPRPTDLSERVLAAVEAGDLRAAASIASHSLYSEDGFSDFAEESIGLWFAYGDEVARQLLIYFHGPMPELDIKASLPTLSVPVLVTHGADDRRVPCAVSEYIARHIPGAVRHVFPGRGHEPLFTAPAEFLDVLRQFIEAGTVASVSGRS